MTQLAVSSCLEMTTSKAKTSELGREFERLRVEAGISQRKAAELLGVDQAAISSFETGRTVKPRIGLAKYKALMNEWETKLGKPQSAGATFTSTVCRECQEEVPATYRGRPLFVCGICGADLGHPCEACGTWNPSRKKFCGDCGKPLTDAADSAAYEARQAVERAARPKADRVDVAEKQARKHGEPGM